MAFCSSCQKKSSADSTDTGFSSYTLWDQCWGTQMLDWVDVCSCSVWLSLFLSCCLLQWYEMKMELNSCKQFEMLAHKEPCLSFFMRNPLWSEGSYSCVEAYICYALQGGTVAMLGKCYFHYNSLYKVSWEQSFCWTTLSLPSLISSANSRSDCGERCAEFCSDIFSFVKIQREL